ncbi:hypothetical protein CYMTET_20911 [Cymbomonas tetramitiformis]|uniref:Uncharacterized protein n=1 Tax=Cymbomonas tetramitiformis TaxID=36881 RepID=A0AAE0L3E5_9CHLO|nr:hypothetical protein CYMTET_20911 [Cymbomonas tetramitiformis]
MCEAHVGEAHPLRPQVEGWGRRLACFARILAADPGLGTWQAVEELYTSQPETLVRRLMAVRAFHVALEVAQECSLLPAVQEEVQVEHLREQLRQVPGSGGGAGGVVAAMRFVEGLGAGGLRVAVRVVAVERSVRLRLALVHFLLTKHQREHPLGADVRAQLEQTQLGLRVLRTLPEVWSGCCALLQGCPELILEMLLMAQQMDVAARVLREFPQLRNDKLLIAYACMAFGVDPLEALSTPIRSVSTFQSHVMPLLPPPATLLLPSRNSPPLLQLSSSLLQLSSSLLLQLSSSPPATGALLQLSSSLPATLPPPLLLQLSSLLLQLPPPSSCNSLLFLLLQPPPPSCNPPPPPATSSPAPSTEERSLGRPACVASWWRRAPLFPTSEPSEAPLDARAPAGALHASRASAFRAGHPGGGAAHASISLSVAEPARGTLFGNPSKPGAGVRAVPLGAGAAQLATLTGEPAADKRVREAFGYRNTPNLSLFCALLGLCSSPAASARAAAAVCQELARKHLSRAALPPAAQEEEVQRGLVTAEALLPALLAAKRWAETWWGQAADLHAPAPSPAPSPATATPVRGGVAGVAAQHATDWEETARGLRQAESSVDWLQGKVELVQTLLVEGVPAALDEVADMSGAQRLCLRLVGAERYLLALHVANKCGIAAHWINEAYGHSLLRIGALPAARTKLRQAFRSAGASGCPATPAASDASGAPLATPSDYSTGLPTAAGTPRTSQGASTSAHTPHPSVSAMNTPQGAAGAGASTPRTPGRAEATTAESAAYAEAGALRAVSVLEAAPPADVAAMRKLYVHIAHSGSATRRPQKDTGLDASSYLQALEAVPIPQLPGDMASEAVELGSVTDARRRRWHRGGERAAAPSHLTDAQYKEGRYLLQTYAPAHLLDFMFRHGRAAEACALLLPTRCAFPMTGGSAEKPQ